MKRYPAKRLGYLLCETCYLLGSIENSMETASRVPFWKIIQLRISVRAKKLSGRSVFETRVCADDSNTKEIFIFSFNREDLKSYNSIEGTKRKKYSELWMRENTKLIVN